MALISLSDVFLTYGGHPLFDGIQLQVEPGDRLCLLGRNGEGKSTLLKLMAGQIQEDKGQIARAPGLSVAFLGQDAPVELPGTVMDVVTTLRGGESDNDAHRVACESYMDRLRLDPNAQYATLSGGLRRRALLARELAGGADILLLDEPTNHLDIDTIIWLEELLTGRIRTCVFVTHDRRFATTVSNRIAELDRGRLIAFNAGYQQFLERRESLLEAEAKARELFDKRLAQEEVWIRRGVKARRVRDEGRVKALEKMRVDAKQRRERQGSVKMGVSSSQSSGDLVAEIKDLSFSWGSNTVFKNVYATVMRGDRIGIVGPNGTGKTTLIRLLLGELQPASGSVRLGTKLEVTYFDQLRDQLDPEQSIAWNLAGNDDSVVVNGKQRHVNAYLQDFLFDPARARNPVSILSGGERNRLLLAKLFTKPSNLLVLDEPTNDLDSDTMDLLEDVLLEYTGTILLVSHDRHFLDNVVSNLLVLEGNGELREFVGNWSDLERDRAANVNRNQTTKNAPTTSAERRREREKKLGFKDAKELAELPEKIAALEAEQAKIHAAMAKPDFYKGDSATINTSIERLKTLETEHTTLWERWEKLEALKASLS